MYKIYCTFERYVLCKLGCIRVLTRVKCIPFSFLYICMMNKKKSVKRAKSKNDIEALSDQAQNNIKAMAKEFEQKVEDIKNKRAKTVSKIPMYQKVLGIAFLPVMFVLFMIDRFLHLFLPHATHASFKLYLIDPTSLKLTLIRMAMAIGIILIVLWVF